ALHARAGDRLAQRMGTLGYLAREISLEVPALLEQLGDNNPGKHAAGDATGRHVPGDEQLGA
ncbi:NAD(P)H-hydrate dehydratase, partial [Acinetobacter baumannii]|nr:NAD(P)H-hydrate dehydratase [Acinetobacter baumannii]